MKILSSWREGPFAAIFRLSVGDFIAKTLNFLTFIYLARVLGVAHYGVLEFALSSSMYFLFLADAGLESWATREASRTADVRSLAGRVLPLRLLLSAITFLLLILVLPLFPDFPKLQPLLIWFVLSSFLQAANLRWSFLGHQKMTLAGSGPVVMQIIFAILVFSLVRNPEHVTWVPFWRLVGEFVMVLYFFYRFAREFGGLPAQMRITGAAEILAPAAVMGASYFLALMSFNFDSVLLGFLTTANEVAWYNAAYKPVTVALAMPVTFFIGIFPVLSREYARDQNAFYAVMVRSLRLAGTFALPLGFGGAFLAKPIIGFLFGPDYSNSVPVLQILVWSAALVILRGIFKQGLISANQQALDLRCALTATTVNVVLNFLLIPRLGVSGAAIATVIAELLWLVLAYYYFNRRVLSMGLLQNLAKPLLAALGMAAFLAFSESVYWIVRAIAALLIYSAVLFVLVRQKAQL